ncbi:hypothetical protein [Flavivirga eckloniae]|uniref:Calcium-mediated lectin domain-containing protein n=1 Tax=Flavivirga eckloniae TaxID=1803846 RepID=A0A2K9PMH0_9FLAO|nr:hypothetical protein [Flavivirga eckloniae]AUP78226.1 hypothetical protein C1H87_05630 [Flavivirga eckloniae]
MATNPVSVTFGSDSTGLIVCNAHAAYYQRVTLTWKVLQSETTVIFSGSGEGVPMKTQDGSTSYEIGATRQALHISALFEYSTSGPNGPFVKAVVNDPIISSAGGTTIVTVTSEDSNDKDNNDSYLIISYKSL